MRKNMKKCRIVLLVVILCFIFTGCGLIRANQILEMVDIEVDEFEFDISDKPQLIEAMKAEDVTVGIGKALWNPQQLVLQVRKPQTPTEYYSVDFENLAVEYLQPKKPQTEHQAISSFAYNGKNYFLTMDEELTMDSGCVYMECDDKITVLTNKGLQNFSASQYYCDNGYIIMAKDTDKTNTMHYMVYSVAENDFIIDEDISYTDRHTNARYDVLSWLDGDRYMHFDTVLGQIIDVTEDFHAVDDNIIDGNTPLDKMLDYRYVWNKVFYTITEEEGIVVYTMTTKSLYSGYIDRAAYTEYDTPYLDEDGYTLRITKAVLKEDRR